MRYIVFIAGIFLAGCVAHVPKQTAALSAEVTKGIAEARRSNKALIKRFGKETRERIEERLHWIWTPRFIRNFLKKIPFDEAVCEAKGLDRAVEVQEIVEAISKQVEKRRRKLFKAVRASERKMLSESENYYDYLESMSRTVTGNLRSVVKSQKMEEKILEAAKKRVPIVDRIDEERKKLEKMMEE